MSATQLCKLFKSNQPYEDIVYGLKDYIHRENTDVILSFFHYVSLWCIENKRGNQELSKLILKYIYDSILKDFKGTMTLTFGEVAESHVGMQKIGVMDKKGFQYNELLKAQSFFKNKGCKTILIKLNDFLPKNCNDQEEHKHLIEANNNEESKAWILVIRNGLKYLTGDEKGKQLLTEMLMFKWDSKLFNDRRKIIQEKRARHNLNFADFKQKANFAKGMGTTVPWNEVPILYDLKKSLVNIFGESAKNLKCEGNMYYEPGKTGIGYHGDTERRKVIGVRLGRPMTIHYMWYYNNRPRGLNASILLNEGDIYCMSEKTVGTDWMAAPKKRYTLRHAAGAEKYTIKTNKIWVKNKRIWKDDNNVTIGDIFYKSSKTKINPNPTWEDMSEFCYN